MYYPGPSDEKWIEHSRLDAAVFYVFSPMAAVGSLAAGRLFEETWVRMRQVISAQSCVLLIMQQPWRLDRCMLSCDIRRSEAGCRIASPVQRLLRC